MRRSNRKIEEDQPYRGGLYRTVDGNILEIHDTCEGYDFTLYDKDMNDIDGGVLEGQDWLSEEVVISEALAFTGHEEERQGIQKCVEY